MNCSECGTANSEKYSFCVNCAEPLVESDPKEKTQKLVVPPQPSTPGKTSQYLTGAVLNKKYLLEAKLGEGITGVVYVATPLDKGNKVAIKVFHNRGINAHGADELFLRELHVLKNFKHPNAVEILDYGITEDHKRYVVTELIEGRTLRELISNQGPLSTSLAAEVISQVCAVLQQGHQQGFTHGDIKPDNILVGEDQQSVLVKVLDFGYAKLSEGASDLTQSGIFVGTPRYMSPEQCQGENVTSSSDIYSLGVVLYEILCGTVPFNAPSPTALAVQHVTKAPTPIHEINHLILEKVESVVFHALAKKPGDRPVSAAAFAREFNDAVETSQQAANDITVQAAAYPSDVTVDLGSTPYNSSPDIGSPTVSEDLKSEPDFLSDQIERSSKQSIFTRTAVLIGVLAFALLLFVGGTAFVVWMFMSSGPDPREEIQSVKSNADNERLPVSQNNSENFNSTTTPVIETADSQLEKLRNERINASPGDTNEIDEKLTEAAKKYPRDYRFTYERARLFKPTSGASDHHKPFSLLFEAARKAIKSNQTDKMSSEITRDANGDFNRLARGHHEWSAIKNALRQKNESLLHEDDH